jgi:hypothetical protein
MDVDEAPATPDSSLTESDKVGCASKEERDLVLKGVKGSTPRQTVSRAELFATLSRTTKP